MFSISAIHPREGEQAKKVISRMYGGNPMAALGHMIIMRKNAVKLSESDPSMGVVVDVVTACIKILSDHLSSNSPSGQEEAH